MTKMFNAVYDGRVIVPDEPLGIQPNSPVRVAIIDDSEPDIVDFQPKTQLVRNLLKLREQALSEGMITQSRTEILSDLAKQRGETDLI